MKFSVVDPTNFANPLGEELTGRESTNMSAMGTVTSQSGVFSSLNVEPDHKGWLSSVLNFASVGFSFMLKATTSYELFIFIDSIFCPNKFKDFNVL